MSASWLTAGTLFQNEFKRFFCCNPTYRLCPTPPCVASLWLTWFLQKVFSPVGLFFSLNLHLLQLLLIKSYSCLPHRDVAKHIFLAKNK